MKHSILDSLKTRAFRFGGYATLVSVGVIAVLLVVNLLVDRLPAKLDLTANKLYSLSDQTLKLLKGLQRDVTVTVLAKTGSEDPTVKEILSRYATASRHVRVANVDPELAPGWAKQYARGSDLRTGAIVVDAGEGQFKTIDPNDLIEWNYDQQTGQPQVTGLTVEQRVTSAIAFVTARSNVTLYVLKGYGADSLSTYGLTTAIENRNYATKDLDLLATGSVPADASVVLLLNPRYDLPTADAEKLRTYLTGGGRLYVALDLQRLPESAPNLEELLGNYGLGVRRTLVIEGDASHYAAPYPYTLLPNLEYHDILSPLRSSNVPLLLPTAMPLEELALKKKDLRIEKLLTTSSNSWSKTLKNGAAATARKEAGDASGPFTLAVAVTDPAREAGGRDTKLILVGSASFLQTQLTQNVPGNGDFFLNGVSWLSEKKDEIAIGPKSLVTYRLRIDAFWSMLLSAVSAIVIPLGVLGAGLGVWLRRRHL